MSVGVPGGIAQYLPGGAKARVQIIDVTAPPYSADKAGTINAAPAIQAAIDAAPAGSVVYLPAGTYRCDAILYIGFGKKNITLRGSGPTTVIKTSSGTGLSVGVSSEYIWSYPLTGNQITSGLQKGSGTVTIADTSEFVVGNMIHFAFANDLTVPIVAPGGGKDFRQQLCMLTAKTGTTLTFSPALYENYGGGTLPAQVNVARLQSSGIGVEDFTLDCSGASTTFGIQFDQCYASWIKGVRVTSATNYAFYINHSLSSEIRECFADQRQSIGSNGAGVLFNSNSGCLVEDNIVYRFFPAIEVNAGSSGNAFTYNFCYDTDVYGAMGCGIDTNHNPHNEYNLYEGNVSPNIQSDGYFGSTSRDTIFRNWFHGTSPTNGKGWVISLNRFTRDYSLIANVFGTPTNPATYSFGNPNMGNSTYVGTAQPSKGLWWADWGKTPGPSGFQEKDLDVEATTVRKLNYLHGSGVPTGELITADPVPNSLIYSSKPGWFGTLNWPAVDTNQTSTLSFESIPAGYRFMKKTSVPGTTTTPPPLNPPGNLRVSP